MLLTKKQVQLSRVGESLQIPYPPGYTGAKTHSPTDTEFTLTREPRFLTLDEVEVAQAFITKLPYTQSLSFTGLVLLDPSDPILSMSHDQLDELEREASLPNSKKAQGGGTRQVRERAYLIRESGHLGAGQKALPTNNAV